ncbi:MAG: hypothetical protein EXS35_15725 [Pedosphaera sp.]|nr:hypothetical protein [Pedosphaera sp.]
MTTETPAAPVVEPGASSRRLAARAARHLKTQVEDWYDECRYLVTWEDENLLDDQAPERLAEHARLLDELERVGRWLASATGSTDFPDKSAAELLTLVLRDLADTRTMWHGKKLDEKQRKQILKACFNES